MELIWIYVLFAVTTSISSMYEIFVPFMQDLQILEPNDLLVQHKYLTYFVFALISFATAPVMFGIIMTPGLAATFRNKLLDTVTSTPTEI